MEIPEQTGGALFSVDLNSTSLFTSSLSSPFLLFSNVSSNFSTQSVPFQGSSTLVTAVISLTVFVLGMTGNTLAIYVVLRYAKMKTVTNIYIFNLAVADELYIVGLPFLTTQNVLSYWPFGSFLCRVVMTADSMNQFTSIFCLTVMSIDRYLAVVHPISSTKWRHPRMAKVVSVAVWAVSFVVVLPVVFFSDVQDTFNSCNMIWPEPKDVWSTAFILYTATLGFFGPLLVISVCYLLIIVKVKSAGARVGFTKRRRSERKATRMVVVIVVVFVFCWLPFFIINIVNLVVIIPESSVTAGIYFFSVILSYANSCANPLLYGFLSDNFKQSFKKVLCVRSLRRKTNGVEDEDHSAPRTEKILTQESSFLSPHNPNYPNPQCGQGVQLEAAPNPEVELSPSGLTMVSPQPRASTTSHAVMAVLHSSSAAHCSPSSGLGIGSSIANVTSTVTSKAAFMVITAEPSTFAAVTNNPSLASVGRQQPGK
ncbi:somatostatin-like receptor F_48D10.1 [Lampris incognitus]|uniref:somatostatin-like receptor F_48D10.1 n=1 Tax=Lampris incognitus TaxID=2546036 RepID=UPI0024B50C80|nr:somatostatin-like receptor F_48D10.1 [Lampris incognitus]